MVCAGKMDKIFVHTAGSIAMDVFKGHAQYYGVLYPLQTFSKQRRVDFCRIPCFLEASDETTATALRQLAQTLTSTIHWTPQIAQTGPAVRFDENIIHKQLELLRHRPRLQKIYELMSQSIHIVAQNQEAHD